MTPERHKQIGELYHRARALRPGERSELLERACEGDPELRADVESLLAADESAESFLDAPATDVAAKLLRAESSRTLARIGRYQLLSAIGRGGMGDVYLAEDPVLRRQVAIKLLAAPLTADARALVRFEQEARAASSLNHPNIVTIHEIGAADEGRYIAMEFVDGRPLSAFLGCAMAESRIVPVARQVAQALAVAHSAGIVHRDVKPENIMLRPDGYVKLLDFGVARLLAPRAESDGSAASLATHAGLLIGTPRYMSPEQIRGEPATPASDVFALGAVFHELATGKHPSEHELTTHYAAGPAVQRSTKTSTQMSRAFGELVRRMLDPNPLARPSAAEVEAHLRTIERQPPRSAVRHIRRPVAVAVAIAVVGLVVAGTFQLLRNRRQSPASQSSLRPIQFQVTPAANTAFSQSSASLSISPDGRWLAYTASEAQNRVALYVKSWDSLDPRRIPNTEGAGQIFWSPDSRWVAFGDSSSGFRLKTVDIARGVLGSTPDVRLAPAGVGAWSARHGIVVKTGAPALQQVPLDGGPPRAVTALDPTRAETAHSFPAFLPDGEHLLYLAASSEPAHDSVAYVKAIGSGEPKRLFKSDSQVVYAEPGYLLYILGFTLLAQPFDAKTLRLTGEPRPVAEQVERNSGSRRGAFTVSQTGVLAYRQHSETQLVWYHRDGRRLQTLGPRGHYRNPALSPDDKTVAVSRLDVKAGAWDIWTIDVERNLAAPSIAEPSLEDMAVWSPDGRVIAFTSQGGEGTPGGRVGVYAQATNSSGRPRVLIEDLSQTALYAWTADGLVYSKFSTREAGGDFDVWRLPLPGDPSVPPVAMLETRFWEVYCQPSPDGQSIAYASDPSGRPEVYVARYPSGGKTLVSVEGGSEPAWRRDGDELFYLSPDRHLMAVPIKRGSIVQAGTPVPLFETAVSSLFHPTYTRNQYLVSGDGQRFLINEPVGKTALSIITVVFNWTARLNGDSGS